MKERDAYLFLDKKKLSKSGYVIEFPVSLFNIQGIYFVVDSLFLTMFNLIKENMNILGNQKFSLFLVQPHRTKLQNHLSSLNSLLYLYFSQTELQYPEHPTYSQTLLQKSFLLKLDNSNSFPFVSQVSNL